jgi:hypothetical protein
MRCWRPRRGRIPGLSRAWQRLRHHRAERPIVEGVRDGGRVSWTARE